ncbi:hypothetical protein Taro_028870 [Colocasia esculenta]|uniref:Uncharacterized protein n=1 Tax=Colocasia esculenta TaxID=4460 RepID=A0A843VYJ7_COLES|nr:hypothetical protein [Colocasia esculenta]
MVPSLAVLVSCCLTGRCRAVCPVFSVRQHRFTVVCLLVQASSQCVFPLVPQLCLEALVAVWCVALFACGGRSSASYCALLRPNKVVALLKLLVLHCNCVASCRVLVLVVAPCARARVVCFHAVWSPGAWCCTLGGSWCLFGTVCRAVFLIVSVVHSFVSLLGVPGVEFFASGTLRADRSLWLYRCRYGVAALPCLGSPIGGAPGFGRGLCPVGVPCFDLDPPEVDVLSSTSAVVLFSVQLPTSSVAWPCQHQSSSLVLPLCLCLWSGLGGRRDTLSVATPRPAAFWGLEDKSLGRFPLSLFSFPPIFLLLSEEERSPPSFLTVGARRCRRRLVRSLERRRGARRWRPWLVVKAP